MQLIKCNNGHYFDRDKYTRCPYCEGSSQNGGGITVPLGKAAPGPAAPSAGATMPLSGVSKPQAASTAAQIPAPTPAPTPVPAPAASTPAPGPKASPAPAVAKPAAIPAPVVNPASREDPVTEAASVTEAQAAAARAIAQAEAAKVIAEAERAREAERIKREAEKISDMWRAPQPNRGGSPSWGNDDNKTVSLYSKSLGVEPVVGWLTAVSGEYFGESFQLKTGRNFVGRSPEMDIQLSMDLSVSRRKHAVIIFEPKSKSFIAQPGDARELFYLNDEVVLNYVILKPYDILSIGDTKLLFIPLCGDKFSWEDMKKN